jgi:thymidylate kinase
MKKEFLQRVTNGFEEIYKNHGNDVIIVNGTESSEVLSNKL